MKPISICVIAKNEENNLPRFFDAIKDNCKELDYEIVFIDTGSTDKTVEIAKEAGAKVDYFGWNNSFSDARNYAASKASNDWILVLDCDEVIESIEIQDLQILMEHDERAIGRILCKNHTMIAEQDTIYEVRLNRFYNKNHFEFQGMIHELLCVKEEKEFKVVDLTLTVDHTGYVGTKEELEDKGQRNIELLLDMVKEHSDPYIYFQLGQAHRLKGDIENAVIYYRKGMECELESDLEYVQVMVVNYGYTLLDLELNEEALLLENIYDAFDGSSDFLCLMGTIYLRTGFVAEAIREFTKATNTFRYQVKGTNTFIPYYNLGCIYEVMEELDTAEVFYKKCGDYVPAVARLGQLRMKE